MRRFGTVNEEEQDERGEWYLAKQIAVGILIAAGVIFLGLHLYAYLAARAAAELAQQAIQQLQQNVEAQGEEMRSQAQARRIEQERRSASELQRRQDVARQTQAAADRARVEAAAATARNEAWQRFYKPPSKCDSPPDWDTQVECGNAHIKARREFEARWENGELR